MLTIGRLADIFGKKKIYQTGMIVFTLGSICCGTSTTIGWLIAFRVFQAIGAAMLMALGNAIVTESYPENQRGQVLGISGLMVSLGVIAGPMLGGLILDALNWRWIFFVNIPIGLIGLIMVQLFVPDFRPIHIQKFDLWGSILLFIGLLLFSLSMTIGQNSGFGQIIPWAVLLGGLFLLGVFLLHEMKTESPLINLGLFRNRLFRINILTGFMTFIISSGSILLIPFYLENVLMYDHRTIGLLMAVIPITMGITAPISGTLSDRYGSRLLTTIGLVFLILAYLSITTLNENTTQIGYILRFIPVGIGTGLFQSPNNSAILGSVPRNSLGVASGLLSLTRTLGQTTGISIMGTIWATRVQFYEWSLGNIKAQVRGIQETATVMVILFGIALCFSGWALFLHVREQQRRKVGMTYE